MSALIDFLQAHLAELREQTLEHLFLTMTAMLGASIVGVSLGIFLTRRERLSGIVLGAVGIIQTIPSLALLGFLLPILGIGARPAIVALFLYALLPIVRNTYTGVKEIDKSVKEAAIGMGMSSWQLLRYVELPMAFPVILAGIRTSTIINIGVATLCALIAAGGLGEFIFRGIYLNNVNMILAGAIPASLLALFIDGYLGILLRYVRNRKVVLVTLAAPVILILVGLIASSINPSKSARLVGGFNSEFMERADGLAGLDSLYDLPLEIKEMEIGLLYQALDNGKVDVIEAFSTDGRIRAYNLRTLRDDKNYFPPYFAAPLANTETLKKHPEVEGILNELREKIDDELMADMNYLVDKEQRPVKEVAAILLDRALSVQADPEAGLGNDPDLLIGSKAFTESFILAHAFAQLIEAKSNIKTGLSLGFGGTKLIFDALRYGDIDIYPEYTGTGLLVILNATEEVTASVSANRHGVYQFVKTEFQEKYNLTWLAPLGFNNTFAIMMREDHANQLNIESISDLSVYLNSTN